MPKLLVLRVFTLAICFIATPPHIPTVSGPEDTSNFDVFEVSMEDDLKYPDLPSKSAGFSGKSLPFVGFTYSDLVPSEDFTDR